MVENEREREVYTSYTHRLKLKQVIKGMSLGLCLL